MTSIFSFSSFGISVDIDSITGTKVNTGLVGVEVPPDGSTKVNILDGELVGVNLTEGVNVDVAGELVGVDLTTGTSVEVLGSNMVDVDDSTGDVKVGVADELVSLDTTEGTAIVEVEEVPINIDLTEGVLVGAGEETLFVDLNEGVGINTDLLADSGIDIPTDIDI